MSRPKSHRLRSGRSLWRWVLGVLLAALLIGMTWVGLVRSQRHLDEPAVQPVPPAV